MRCAIELLEHRLIPGDRSVSLPIKVAGMAAQACLWQAQWLLWATIPVLDFEAGHGIVPRTTKHFLTTPFPASLNACDVDALVITPEMLLNRLIEDMQAAFRPSPLAVGFGTVDSFNAALRNAMLITGCYAVVPARHPSAPNVATQIRVIAIGSGELHDPGQPLFRAILDLFQPTAVAVSNETGTLDATQCLIDMPFDVASGHSPSHHERIAAAADLRALFAAHVERLGHDQASLDDLVNQALSTSAW